MTVILVFAVLSLIVGLEAVGAVTGLLGLYNQSQAQKKQESIANKGLKLTDQQVQAQLKAQKEIQALAANYDPKQETQAAVDYASKVTGDTLTKSLKNAVANYAQYGGVPGLSSTWNVKTQGLTNRITDPLRAFIADRATGDTQRKIAAWQASLGASQGNLSDQYFKASQMVNVPSAAGSVSSIVQGLQAIIGNSSGKGGAGGSGDWRDNQKTQSGGWNA